MKDESFCLQLTLSICRIFILILYKIEDKCLRKVNKTYSHTNDNDLPEGDNQYDEPFVIISHYLVEQMHFKDKNITLNEVVHHCHINRSLVVKTINVKTHCNFSGYIKKLRIDYACSLLLDPSNYKIEFISDASGFNNSRTFLRNFRLQQNMPPSEFRRVSQIKKDLILLTKC